MNPVQALMARHRSIRRFAPEELDGGTLRRAVEAAQMAASSSNIQAYSLLHIRDAGKRERLAELCGAQAMVATAGAFLVVCGDARRHRLLAERTGRAFVANLETFLLAVVDASLFAQNLALALESEGLGICFVGGLRTRLPEADRVLAIPDDVFPLFGLCVGVPAEEPAPRPRLPVEAILFDERYPGDEELLARIARYDETMSAYYARRGKRGYDWSGGVSRKFAKPLREHLHDYYRSKGAHLS